MADPAPVSKYRM